MMYAAHHHVKFGNFTQRQFSRLNSRISISDLYGYARNFDGSVHQRFSDLMSIYKERYQLALGIDPSRSYSQILSWRHDFAHAGIRNTTVEEAFATHQLAKRVLYAFDKAFSGDLS